ncbi:MAG TPA: MFS transporter [Planctomycetota bacterium]|nr:MFS transporter [Planctomycetota bacterium]
MTATASTAPPLPGKLNVQLSVMMFLQYAIWGAWLPILFPFLMGHRGFTLDQAMLIFGAGAIGAIFGPFFAGQLADRHFATEKFLAALHLSGAILVWFLSTVKSFPLFLGLSTLYGLIYAPTISLTNSLSFAHLPDRDRDFGRVRVWGTIGWIAAGIAMGHWLLIKHSPAGLDLAALGAAQNAGRADAFRLSAILGLVMAVLCLKLPHTPPSKEAKAKSAAFAAVSRIRFQPLLTLFLIAVPISMIHQFYFVHTSSFLSEIQNREQAAQSAAAWINKILGVGGGGLMTVGQMMEIAVLAFMPLLTKKISRKGLLAMGIMAYAARMALFGYTTSMVTVILGVALHGFCFGCFIFVAYMIVDEESPADLRASAQNLFNLVIIGIGIIVGSWFSLSIVAKWAAVSPTQMNYTKLFSVPMWMALACLVLLFVMYPSRRKDAVPASVTA